MSSTYGPVVPEGQYPPFAVVTPDDHTAWILIATALCMAYFVFFGGVRFFVGSTISHGFGMDDSMLYAATVLAVIQSSIILGACSKGLGKAIDKVSPEAQDEVQRMYYTSNLFFIMALGLSKISVLCFLRRISQIKRHLLVFNIALGLIAVWTLASLLAIALQCNLQHPWISINEKCPGVLRRWQIIGAFDIISEVALVGLIGFLVFALQTSVGKKAKVVGIFSIRLLIIVSIAFRLGTFDQAGFTTNPFLREARFIAWTQCELAYSLISATIPTFQSFLKSLNTGFGGIGPAESGYGYGYGSGSRSRSRLPQQGYQLSKLRSTNKSVAQAEPEDGRSRVQGPAQSNVEIFRPGPSGGAIGQWNRSEVTAVEETTNEETTSIGSDGSGRMMIRKELLWSVSSEPRQ